MHLKVWSQHKSLLRCRLPLYLLRISYVSLTYLLRIWVSYIPLYGIKRGLRPKGSRGAGRPFGRGCGDRVPALRNTPRLIFSYCDLYRSLRVPLIVTYLRVTSSITYLRVTSSTYRYGYLTSYEVFTFILRLSYEYSPSHIIVMRFISVDTSSTYRY